MRYNKIDNDTLQLTIIQRILLNRGLQLNDIEHYLNTTEQDILDPQLLDRIQEGAEMLLAHISANDDIFIQVDSDCDGYTSAALLLNYLYDVYPDYVIQHITVGFHSDKGHGILLDAITPTAKLVIAPDSSSSEYEIHQALSEAGIDVLVLDHHQSDQVSQYACVINNQLCDYPTKSLSGVGIVYKFCSYLDTLLHTSYANNYLDLVALGLIADVMNLRDFETRQLIVQGLTHINNSFLQGMVEKNSFSLKGRLTPTGIAFYIAPFINAVCRSGTDSDKTLLFLSLLTWKAEELIPSTKRGERGREETRVTQAIRTSSNVKARQDKARDKELEQIENMIAEKGLLSHKILVICFEQALENKNLAGLIANKMMARYQKPTIVLTKQDNLWSGSARNYDRGDLKDFRQFCLDSQLVELAAGHPSAFGIEILEQNLQPFIEHSDNALQNIDFTPCYNVDEIYTIDTLNPQDIIDIGCLENLWGQGMEEPLLAIENIKITRHNLTLMSPDKNPTLKISLPNGINLIKFKFNQEALDNLCPPNGYAILDVVGKCNVNVWQDNVYPQIIIEDFNIIEKQGYDF